MRIVYLHQYFNALDEPGSTRSFEFAKRLVERGHEVHVVTSQRGAGRDTNGWSVVKIEGIRVHRVPISYDNSMGIRKRLHAFVDFAVKAASRARGLRGNVLVATSTPLTIILPAWFASLGRRTPIVFEVRDSWPTVPIALGYLKNPFAKYLARRLESFAYRRAAYVIALSEGMQKDAILHGADPARIAVIPNASDVELFDVDCDVGFEWRKRHGIGREASVVLYSGTFGAANGVGYLIELAGIVAESVNDVIFVLVGAGAELDRVTRRAKDLNLLDEHVRIFPPVPKSEMPAILSASTIATSVVIANPAMEANSANKVFDALASGTPIAINHGGWQANLVRDRQIGIVLDASNLERAASELMAFLSDRTSVQRSGEAARSLARSEFSRDKLARRFMHVIESVVSS